MRAGPVAPHGLVRCLGAEEAVEDVVLPRSGDPQVLRGDGEASRGSSAWVEDLCKEDPCEWVPTRSSSLKFSRTVRTNDDLLTSIPR